MAPARCARPRVAAPRWIVMMPASSLLCFLPGRIGVIRGHRFDLRVGVGTEIPLVNDPVLIDDEGHHAGHVVLRWPRDERKSARHSVADHVILRPTGGGGTLRGQYLEVVAVERRSLRSLVERNVVLGSLRDQIAEWTSVLTLDACPVEPVLAPLVATERSRVRLCRLSVMAVFGVQLLRRNVGAASLDHGQLVAPDSPGDYFLFPCERVEPPLSTVVHDRNRKRPGLVADDEGLGLTIIDEPPTFAH